MCLCHAMKLLLYPNQVAGKECLLATEDNAALCKLRNVNELEFYLNMSKALQPFTPQFLGTVDVTASIDETKSSYTYEAHFQAGMFISGGERADRDESDAKKENPEEYRALDVTNLTTDTGFQHNECTRDARYDVPASTALCRVGENPWVQRVRGNGRRDLQEGSPITYIVLENISKKFKRPCILDLKIGTQIYAQESCQEKWQKRLAKNELTTTRSLGIRLAGMQVYQGSAFICRDKFYGRGLSKEGLRECIRLYFSSGERLQNNILEDVMKQVLQLTTVLENLEGHRLLGCSIVAFYEGIKNDFNGSGVGWLETKPDVRILDFSKAKLPKNKTFGPDKGFIFGLTNFLLMMEEIKSVAG